MTYKTPPRVFIGFSEIAGFYSGLRTGLEACGCQVSFVEAKKNRFNYDSRGNSTALEQRIYQAFFGESVSRWTRLIGLFHAIRQHDVFIFSYGISFPGRKPHWALPWLKCFRKKIVFILTGSEARPPYIGRNGFCTRDGHPVSIHELLESTRNTARNIRLIEQYADLTVAHTLTAQFLSQPFISFLRLGNPASFAALNKVRAAGLSRSESQSIRILHAPSWPELKGSERIRHAVSALQSEGFNIDYTELTDVPNIQIIEELTRTDLLIDQLYSDIPMASLAVEAASLEVPALVGGYGWDYLLQSTDGDVMPPTFLCEPEKVTERLREILRGGKDAIERKGKEAKAFLSDHWQPKEVASRLLQCVETEPLEWVIDPVTCDYPWGCGVSKTAIAEMLSTIQSVGGDFFIDDKPHLLANYQSLQNTMSDSESDTINHELVEMIERNKQLQLKLKALTEKLENFGAMKLRRDKRIAKLEQRLKK
ncbi:MAG: hypothetical protein P8J87_05405 [Verrucomicrobiales bacterium]|nr:hypothetical protein [Verrucomicrobiales bacterium]